jgi:predicted 3-demethylubiquinone-9 3-methyltransferase (glyoxalase superfamily)
MKTQPNPIHMSKVTPFLWFDTQAEEAAHFYVSLFKNSKVTMVNRNGDQVFMVTFELDGQEFIALNAGPQFKFNEAVSFFISCEDQAEVDHFWNAFTTDGGEESQCGWVKDKYGLSWQIVPKQLGQLMSTDSSGRVMKAMLGMKKIEIQGLQDAYEGK